MLEERAAQHSQNGSTAVPETFDEQKINGYKGRLHDFFEIVDDNENGYLDIEEFKSLLNYLNIRSLKDSQIVNIYLDMQKKANTEQLSFDDVFKYVHSIIFIREDLNQHQLDLFDAMLTADHLNQCQLGGITQFLNRTWAKFAQYRRHGNNNQLVMSAGDNIAVFKEGTYTLLDLLRWNDGLATIEPQHVVIKGVRTYLDKTTSWLRKAITNKEIDTSIFFPSQIHSLLSVHKS